MDQEWKEKEKGYVAVVSVAASVIEGTKYGR